VRRSSPPNAIIVIFGTGSNTSRSTRPSGVSRTTFEPPYTALQ
jgi:hypothetical protein